jgi:hypothetical protein
VLCKILAGEIGEIQTSGRARLLREAAKQVLKIEIVGSDTGELEVDRSRFAPIPDRVALMRIGVGKRLRHTLDGSKHLAEDIFNSPGQVTVDSSLVARKAELLHGNILVERIKGRECSAQSLSLSDVSSMDSR